MALPWRFANPLSAAGRPTPLARCDTALVLAGGFGLVLRDTSLVADGVGEHAAICPCLVMLVCHGLPLPSPARLPHPPWWSPPGGR
eukprot:9495126-Pyramimonas_sp.AAC.1